jgi:hypothetical protein
MDKKESKIMNSIYLILVTTMFWLVVIYPISWLHNYISYLN